MKRINELKYREFVPFGIKINTLLKWYLINILTFNRWLIVVATPAAGRSGGKHIDIYSFKNGFIKSRLLNSLRENKKGEEIYLFGFLDFFKIIIFLLKRKGGCCRVKDPPNINYI